MIISTGMRTDIPAFYVKMPALDREGRLRYTTNNMEELEAMAK